MGGLVDLLAKLLTAFFGQGKTTDTTPQPVPDTTAAPAAAPPPPAGKAFFDSVRAAFGPLSQPQVNGFQALLAEFTAAKWPIAYAAYALATAWHETNTTMQPVRESYWLSEEWRRTHLRYYPWYGRGFVQLTWDYNYKKADDKLGLGGTLIANPDRAMELDIAAKVMVHGMAEGWFSGKKLADYLPASGNAPLASYVDARHIINGTDKAAKIADYATKFETALTEEGF